jgi:hypothetical protein
VQATAMAVAGFTVQIMMLSSMRGRDKKPARSTPAGGPAIACTGPGNGSGILGIHGR